MPSCCEGPEQASGTPLKPSHVGVHTIIAEDAVRAVRWAAWVGLMVNVLLATGKFVAGIAGHSEAVIADAVHSISDLITDIAVIAGVRYWSAPADEHHPHGHGRIETLITVGIGLALGAVAVGLAWDAGTGLRHGLSGIPSGFALIAPLVSIASKEALYRWTMVVARRTESQALAANAWHHRSDAMSSLPAAIAVGVALIEPRWAFVDQIGALIVCHFIFYAAWKIIRPGLAQLVDTAAPEAQRQEIERLALGVDGVRSAHALRTRYLGSELAVDLHVEVPGDLSVKEGYEVAREVRTVLLEQGPKVADVIVQVEPHAQETEDD